eukprot:scaffold53885_cov46-Attheya_sp.AAC.1
MSDGEDSLRFYGAYVPGLRSVQFLSSVHCLASVDSKRHHHYDVRWTSHNKETSKTSRHQAIRASVGPIERRSGQRRQQRKAMWKLLLLWGAAVGGAEAAFVVPPVSTPTKCSVSKSKSTTSSPTGTFLAAGRD